MKNKFIKKAIFIVLGGSAGFAYYYFIGCVGNSCPLTSNPYISTAYGMMVGFVLGLDGKKAKEKGKSE